VLEQRKTGINDILSKREKPCGSKVWLCSILFSIFGKWDINEKRQKSFQMLAAVGFGYVPFLFSILFQNDDGRLDYGKR